ncbi:MAG: phosphatidylglycerophosphatase A [Candidatus Acidiferrales bacterium]
MKNNVEPSASAAPPLPAASAASAQSKPRLALFIATAGGLGYLPVAPGTWGSLLGVALGWLLLRLWPHTSIWEVGPPLGGWALPFGVPAAALIFAVAAVGVWAADRSAKYLGARDPQVIVVDEVSGQMIPLLFAFGSTERYLDGMSNFQYGFWWHGDARWKYLLLGFILFRVFDIWKPFPARQAESLPGGWGIMADDWIAGIYAAIGLWGARALGL